MENLINNIPIKVIKSNRKTVSVEVKADGIIVRAPYRMGEQAIHEFLLEKSSWIEKNYMILQERAKNWGDLTPFTDAEIDELAEKALTVIPGKVKYYAKKLGVTYGRITIRNQRTRWGSCSSKGNLNFNCLLMLFPDDVIDSVVVHELCHLKHMDHSAEFYAEVERAFPEYRRCQKWLKEHGGGYLRRLP